MIRLLCFVLAVWASPFKSKIRLAAENAALRHQLIVLRRKLRGHVQPANSDRWFLVQLYRWFPSILKVLTIIRSETLVRWHRAGGVLDIAINHVTDQRAENNWSLCVLSAGTADANTAARAALYVQHALRHDYDLMTD
jgi:hypothetical protein